jgi:hypothetical protein
MESMNKNNRGQPELTREYRTHLSGGTIHLEVSDGQGKKQGQSRTEATAIQPKLKGPGSNYSFTHIFHSSNSPWLTK